MEKRQPVKEAISKFSFVLVAENVSKGIFELKWRKQSGIKTI
ncbi:MULTISPECIES: hypothetical protein [Streptococcus]|nr:hypothetical protein [Streptococcus acidominimus]